MRRNAKYLALTREIPGNATKYTHVRRPHNLTLRHPIARHIPAQQRLNGTSGPLICEFDDYPRFVRWNRPHGTAGFRGPKSCFNELVSSRLAQLIDAPALLAEVVFVSAEIASEHPLAVAGLHSGTRAMFAEAPDGDLRLERDDHFGAAEASLNAVSNRNSFPDAVVLLSWLLITEHAVNPDGLGVARTDQGFFIENFKVIPNRTQRLYRVTDLELAFAEVAWPDERLHNIDEAYELPFHLARLVTDTDLEQAFGRLSAVEECDIAECFEEYPQEWCPLDHRDAALEWTLARKRLICKRWQKRGRHLAFADRDLR